MLPGGAGGLALAGGAVAAARGAEALPSTAAVIAARGGRLVNLRAGRRAVVALCLTRAAEAVAIHGGVVFLPCRRLAGGGTEAPPTAGIIALGILRRVLSAVVLRHGGRVLYPRSGAWVGLVELAALHRIRLLMGEDAVVRIAARDHGSLTVREALVGGTRGKRHLPPDDACRTDLSAGGTHHVIEATVLEIVGRDGANAISVVRISIDV